MEQGKRVLIIDDEIDLCLLLKGYFLRKKYEVHIAHSILEGTNLIHELQPAIIFIDNNLPDGHGWDRVPVLAEQYPDTNFYLLSAFRPTPPPLAAYVNYSVIEKPISLSDLDKKFSYP